MKSYFAFIKKFLKDNKKYIFFALLYITFCIFLFIITPLSEKEINLIIENTKEYIEKMSAYDNFDSFALIFANNLFVAFIIVLSGFLFSIFSALIALSNVFTIWVVLSVGIQKVWIFKSLLATLPHWIIEITAILLTLALSFKITYLIVKKIWNWKKYKIWLEIIDSFIFFLEFVIPLIFIAAFIEAFITPLFLHNF